MYSQMEKYFATYKAKFEMLFDDAQQNINKHAVSGLFCLLLPKSTLYSLTGCVQRGDEEERCKGGGR